MRRLAESRYGLPLIAGLLLAWAYYLPPPVLNLLAFVPLLYWLDRERGGSTYRRLAGGFLFGLVTHLITIHFMYAMARFSWLAWLLYAAIVLLFALRISLIVALAGWLRERTGFSWGLLLPACWLPFEWIMTFGDLRMTVDHVSHSLSKYPFLVQFADLLGPYGVGAFMLAVNGLAYEALLLRGRPAGRRAAVALGLVLALVLGYDTWAWNRALPDAGRIRVGLVQPNISQKDKLDMATAPRQWEVLERLTREAAALEPDVIVWPESSWPWPLYHWLDRPDTRVMRDLQALVREIGIPLVAGVEYVQVRTVDDYDLYNAAMVIDANGTIRPEWSAKVYLVPFTESLPFRGLLEDWVGDRGGEWVWLAGGFRPGPERALLDVDGTQTGALVCYEQMFPDLARGLRNKGAAFQLVITNDAWFGRTLYQGYQADALRMRAIENRSEFVRVANTGISGRVDRRGRFHEATTLYEPAVQAHDIELAGPPTLYDRGGDVIVWLVLAGLAAFVALALKRGGRIRPPL